MTAGRRDFKGAFHQRLAFDFAEIVGKSFLRGIKFGARVDYRGQEGSASLKMADYFRKVAHAEHLHAVYHSSLAGILLRHEECGVAHAASKNRRGEYAANGAQITVQTQFAEKHAALYLHVDGVNAFVRKQ